jgi:phosphoribosyl-ATP pyrophosphohydrolase
MITCEEAKYICSKTQYDDASFWEILKLKFHLLICKACAAFSKKNTRLTTLCSTATIRSLPEKDKRRMKKKIEEES